MSAGTVRPATEKDAAGITELVRLLARENGETTPLTPSHVRDFLSVPGCGVLLAEVDGAVTGMLSYSRHPGLYHAAPSLVIEDLVVQPAFRGRGLGGRLVAEAMDLARKEGCAEVSVSTMPENKRAKAFYRRLGLIDEAV